MGKILHFIAKETQGECFTSFKYCYDNVATPIEYDNEDADETCVRYGFGSLSYLEQEKSGIEKGLEDIRKGNVYHAKNSQDLITQILG